jgi:RNA polymerase sigma-70 factor, ECF subfamily
MLGAVNRSGSWVTQGGVAQNEPDDAELLALVADGDRGALEALYGRHAPWLYLRLGRRCADQTLVEESVQDTFVTLWSKAGRWKGDGEVAAYIWGIGVRTLMNRMRPRAPLLQRLAGRRSDDLESAEERVMLGIEHGELGPAIDRLSPELRSVVQATVLDGLTTREAAHLLDIPAGTVKTRMQRARRELREALA